MKNGLLVATGLATGLLAGAPATASAGGYLGLALGSEPGFNDNLSQIATPLGRSLRGLAGIRFGNLSIEGALNGFTVIAGNVDRNVYLWLISRAGREVVDISSGGGFGG